MKNIGILIMIIMALLGCRTSGPQTYSNIDKSAASEHTTNCVFDQIPGKEYMITLDNQKYISGNFYYNTTKGLLWYYTANEKS